MNKTNSTFMNDNYHTRIIKKPRIKYNVIEEK